MRQVTDGKDHRHVFRGPRIAAAASISKQPRQNIRGGLLHVPSPPLQFTGVPYRRPNLSAISEMVVCCSSIVSQPLAVFSCEHHLEGQPKCSQCSTELFPHFELRKPLKCLFSPWRHWKLFWAFMVFREQYFEAILNTDMFGYLKFASCM